MKSNLTIKTKRCLLSALCVILTLLMIGSLSVSSDSVVSSSRTSKHAVAVVFDNSSSMNDVEASLCRAMYGVEVFAAMLNDNDTMLIYPMNRVFESDANGNPSSNPMPYPVRLTGPDAQKVHKMISAPGLTPFQTVIDAAEGLEKESGIGNSNKWLVVLTDGEFDRSYNEVESEIQKMLDKFNVVFIGIGEFAMTPGNIRKGKYEYFSKNVKSSAEVINTLVESGNAIFGRKEIKANNGKFSFDIDLSKLIVFIQGENISGITVKDSKTGKIMNPVATHSPQFTEKTKNGDMVSVDRELQGMLVTYEYCEAGEYDISYNGTAKSLNIYYEPDVSLNVEITDGEGSPLNNQYFYPGKYTVKYNLKNRKGEEVDSTLLGNVIFQAQYTLNGQTVTKDDNASKGSFDVDLKYGDVLDLNYVQVDYLDDYRIRYEKSDLIQCGWPSGGVNIKDIDFNTIVSGGQSEYSISEVEKNGVYTVTFESGGNKITGSDFQNVKMNASIDGQSVTCISTPGTNCYDVVLRYENGIGNTVPGTYKLVLEAEYTAFDGSIITQKTEKDFKINDEIADLKVRLETDGKFWYKRDIEGRTVRAYITLDGKPLTDAELSAYNFTIDAEELEYDLKLLNGKSAYEITFKENKDCSYGKHTITAEVSGKDKFNRDISSSDSLNIRIMWMPIWLIIAIIFIVIAIIIAIIFFYLNKKVLPDAITYRRYRFVFADEDVPRAPYVNYKDAKLVIRMPTYEDAPFLQNDGITFDLTADCPRKTPLQNKFAKAKVSSINCSYMNRFNCLDKSFVLEDGNWRPDPLRINDGRIYNDSHLFFTGLYEEEAFTLDLDLVFSKKPNIFIRLIDFFRKR